MIIPDGYYTEDIEVKLTKAEIETIIDILKREEYSIYMFLNLDRIAEKLKKELNK